MKMNSCLQNIFTYFDNVLHPAGGWSDNVEKRKRKSQKQADNGTQSSPESLNMRASAKKQDKLRRNPAP
jgi:hypothetical protein